MALMHSIKHTQVESFKSGWIAGCGAALLLATGVPADGGVPYDGPKLPREFYAWADRALSKLETVEPRSIRSMMEGRD